LETGKYKAILLDAGGVILDETEYELLTEKIIIEVISAMISPYGKNEYMMDLQESIEKYSPHNRQYIIWKHCKNDLHLYTKIWGTFRDKWKEINNKLELMAGIERELEILADRYELILAGQYGDSLIKLLEEKSLIHLFKTRLSQDAFSITKPDPRYFADICKAANVECRNCVMVGDRIDKDVIPAKQNSMATVFIRSGIYKYQKPRTPDEIPDLILESVYNMANSIIGRLGSQLLQLETRPMFSCPLF
jgi:HAD superfamily hydrolase (TIGR01549 family)